jgi:hypothetical protein
MPTNEGMLNTIVEKSLMATYNKLEKRGGILSHEKLKAAYEIFRLRFGPDKLKTLDGEILLNTIHGRGDKNSLVYWLEFKNDTDFPNSFGSIKGGNSLKFGIAKKVDTGEWTTGNAINPTILTTEQAVAEVRKHRDQLLAAAAALKDLPAVADDQAYLALQKQLNDIAPDVCDAAWGHKYLHLLFPDKVDDYHVDLWQRHHLIKLLLTPVSSSGLFESAGQFVRVANQFGWPMNHLTAVLNERDGNPIRYWRVGTKLDKKNNSEDIWPDMVAGGYAAIGWPALGDLSGLLNEKDARERILNLLNQEYSGEYDARVASRKAGEIKNFAREVLENDVIFAADGMKIRGVGRVLGPYRFDDSNPEDAPHRRQVEWHDCSHWKLPVSDGLQTTFKEIKEDFVTLVEAERFLLEPIMKPSIVNTLPAPFNRFFASFAEANDGFELLKTVLFKLGVDAVEYAKDRRICMSLAGEKKFAEQLRLSFGNWAVLTFQNLSVGENRGQYVCQLDQKPASAIYKEGNHFSDEIDGKQFGWINGPVAKLYDPASPEHMALLASLNPVAKRFDGWKAGPWSINHNAQILQMVFDQQLRHELLNKGLYLAGEGPKPDDDTRVEVKLPTSLNTILYGPPGTGKTFKLRDYYMPLFTDRESTLSKEERALALVKDLAWWEVVALALMDLPLNQASVAQILDNPLVQARLKLSANKNPRAMLWAALQTHTKKDCPTVNYTTRIEPLLFSKDEASLWSIDVPMAENSLPDVIQSFKAFKNPLPAEQVNVRYKFTTFHQSFSYEDFIEGIKPKLEGESDGQIAYENRDGIFKEICNEARANYPKPYALFIDEINRGNVASIFGELITLIEDDKRMGQKNEMSVTLPYSREDFGVPDNLYIIGTMNTADRSVEALDTALRRRFTFEEMKPDRNFIPQPAGLSVDLPNLFAVINARLEKLLDHDHCIGHAYFMKIGNLEDLRCVFANKIIPLLREYFYGNPAKIGLVLGDRFISQNNDEIKFATGDWGIESLDEKPVYQLNEASDWTEEDFKTVYA